MTATDSLGWFSHTATIPPTACQQVTRQLADYACTVADQARIHLGEGLSICVSGSLARGEPAVRRCRSGYALSSDVDLVAVVDDPGDRAPIDTFTRALLEAHPDIDTTVFTVGCRKPGYTVGQPCREGAQPVLLR